MCYVLENEFCRLECIEDGGQIQHFIDKENDVELMYQGDQGWSGKNPTLLEIPIPKNMRLMVKRMP